MRDPRVSKTKTAAGKARCLACGRPLNQSGEVLYSKPDETLWGLCGKPKKCREQYEAGRATT